MNASVFLPVLLRRVNHVQRNRTQLAGAGGVDVKPTTVKGCRHALAGFSFLREKRTKTATKVGFGGPQGVLLGTVEQRIKDAANRKFLSQEEKKSMLAMVLLAKNAGVYPAVKIER